jgi:hypothetical protein
MLSITPPPKSKICLCSPGHTWNKSTFPISCLTLLYKATCNSKGYEHNTATITYDLVRREWLSFFPSLEMILMWKRSHRRCARSRSAEVLHGAVERLKPTVLPISISHILKIDQPPV